MKLEEKYKANDEMRRVRAINSINKAYRNLYRAIDADDEKAADHWSELYECRLERYAHELGISYSLMEDWATDARMFGIDCC